MEKPPNHTMLIISISSLSLGHGSTTLNLTINIWITAQYFTNRIQHCTLQYHSKLLKYHIILYIMGWLDVYLPHTHRVINLADEHQCFITLLAARLLTIQKRQAACYTRTVSHISITPQTYLDRCEEKRNHPPPGCVSIHHGLPSMQKLGFIHF